MKNKFFLGIFLISSYEFYASTPSNNSSATTVANNFMSLSRSGTTENRSTSRSGTTSSDILLAQYNSATSPLNANTSTHNLDVATEKSLSLHPITRKTQKITQETNSVIAQPTPTKIGVTDLQSIVSSISAQQLLIQKNLYIITQALQRTKEGYLPRNFDMNQFPNFHENLFNLHTKIHRHHPLIFTPANRRRSGLSNIDIDQVNSLLQSNHLSLKEKVFIKRLHDINTYNAAPESIRCQKGNVYLHDDEIIDFINNKN